MGLGTYAFVKGFTGDLRDSIDKREEVERDRQKSIFLEKLRQDTYRWQKDIDEIYARKNPDKDQEQIDYTKGVKILKNKQGDTIREVPLTASEMEQYGLETRGKKATLSALETKAKYADQEAQMGLARDRAAINASDASAANSRASAGLAGAQLKGLGAQSTGGTALDDRAAELLYRNKPIQEDLIRAGVPAEVVTDLATQVYAQLLARGEPPSKAQETFIQAAGRLRAKAKKTNTWSTKPNE